MCVAIGFWNDVHVDIEKLRAEGSDFGPVLRIMPHPTKAPHKHAFMQYSSRSIAENAKMALRKKLNQGAKPETLEEKGQEDLQMLTVTVNDPEMR